jgi:hypothetical protein
LSTSDLNECAGAASSAALAGSSRSLISWVRGLANWRSLRASLAAPDTAIEAPLEPMKLLEGLSILLRRAEGEAAWRSAIAMGSGALFVALGLSGMGNEAAVAFRAGDLDPQIARYAFDQGQAAFANGRVARGSFAICCGWVIASTRFLPRWVGWLAIASAAGLALSRISWTSYIWLLPYLMFWLWVITVAVLLLRRNFRRVARSG